MTAPMLFLGFLTLPMSVVAPAVEQAPTVEVVEGQYLRLESVADPLMQQMIPGVTANWDVSVSVDAPTPGIVDLELEALGDLSLIVDVSLCSEPWRDAGCHGIESQVLKSHAVVLNAAPRELLSESSNDPLYLRVSAALPPDAVSPGASTFLMLHAHGHEEDLTITPPGTGTELAPTGSSGLGVTLMAVGAIVAGVAGARLLSAGFRRREDST